MLAGKQRHTVAGNSRADLQRPLGGRHPRNLLAPPAGGSSVVLGLASSLWSHVVFLTSKKLRIFRWSSGMECLKFSPNLYKLSTSLIPQTELKGVDELYSLAVCWVELQKRGGTFVLI